MNVFLDSSALVKLLAREPECDVVESLYESATRLFASSLGYVETRSALAAMRRARRLSGVRAGRARLELERIWRDLTVVRLDDRIVGLAGDVAEQSRLRAGDAVQLASMLAVADPELVLAVWDGDLRRAAVEAGLMVVP